MSRPLVVKRPNALWWNISKFFMKSFARVWFRLRIEGGEHLPATGPVIFVANHSSYLDPPLVGMSSPRWLLFLAQAGLARFAPVRLWLRQVGVTLIDREAPSKAALRLLSDSLKAGHPVGIFPEGTRSRDGTVGPFRNGVEFLVRRTGATVVPVGIDGSFRAMPRSAWLPRPRKIVVRFGPPWPAERVLAAGGTEELRRQVAELARAELRDESSRTEATSDSRSDDAVLSPPVLSDPARSASPADANPSRHRQSS